MNFHNFLDFLLLSVKVMGVFIALIIVMIIFGNAGNFDLLVGWLIGVMMLAIAFIDYLLPYG